MERASTDDPARPTVRAIERLRRSGGVARDDSGGGKLNVFGGLLGGQVDRGVEDKRRL